MAINFGKPEEQFLSDMTLSDARRYFADGHFPSGSMGPKIAAAVQFIRNGGKKVIIGDLNQAMEALRGDAGTHLVPDDA